MPTALGMAAEAFLSRAPAQAGFFQANLSAGARGSG